MNSADLKKKHFSNERFEALEKESICSTIKRSFARGKRLIERANHTINHFGCSNGPLFFLGVKLCLPSISFYLKFSIVVKI